MSFKRTVYAPNGRELLILGNVNIDQNLIVDENGFIGIDLTVVGTTRTDRLEVASESILNTQTSVFGNLDVVGNTTITDKTDITGTTTITGENFLIGNTTITANNAGEITIIEGNLLVKGDGTQTLGSETSSIDTIFVDRLKVNLLTELNTDTFINGNLYVNGVFVQSIGNSANLIEDYFGNAMQVEYLTVNQDIQVNKNLTVDGNGIQTFGRADARMETYYGNDMIVANLTVDNLGFIENLETNTLIVNQETVLNNNTTINGNLTVNGVNTQIIGNANNLIEEAFIENASIQTATIQSTETQSLTAQVETTLNNNVQITGGPGGTQNIGANSTSRVDEVWTDFANTNDLEVENSTELNGDVTIIGNGTQTFGQDNAFNRIDDYYGVDMDLSGDLFMLDDNKKDFLDLDTGFVIYVKKNGDDNRSGNNISNAVKTIRRGMELAKKFRLANPVGDLDSTTTTVLVSVYPGIYVEEGELEVPENAAVVSAGGQYVTEVHMSDAGKRNFRNMFLLNSGSYVQGFTFRNMELDSFDDPSGGFAYAFAPGAIIKRSPYVRDSSQVSNYNPSAIAAPLDPANANPAVGKGAGMILADRRVLNPNTIWPYILAFGATPRSPNGIGYCARNGAGINGISSLGIFQRTCFYALDGGQITLNNSGTQFGDISMQATGFIDVVEEKATAVEIVANPVLAANIIAQANVLVNGMWDDLVSESANGNVVGPDGNLGVSWDTGFIYNETLCSRDVGYIIDAVSYDLALNTNYNSLTTGTAYQRGATSAVITDQLKQTTLAIEYVRDFLIGDTTTTDDLALDEDNDSLPGTISGLVDPSLPESGLNLNDYSRKELYEKFEIILEKIRIDHSVDAYFVNPSTAIQDEIDAKDLLQANKAYIQQEVVDYVDLNYPSLVYDANLCFRDVGFIVDALTHDVLYGGNYANRIVADSYYSGTTAQIPGNESNATIDAYNELQNIVSNVVLGTYPGQITTGNTATAAEANVLVNLLDITIDVLVAGNTTVIPALVAPDTNVANANIQADVASVVSNKATVQSNTITFINDTYSTYYEDLVKRDATNLLTSISNDIGAGTQMVTQAFSLGLYTWNAQKVYPVYQEPAFIHTWEYLKEELAPIAGGNSTNEYAMIVGLIDDVLVSTVLDPTVISFSSLIESLAHQFNNAGAGVNRNALPLNFGKPGFNRPVPFSVLQENGGRVRWSGADELNNQYFAGGTRINGVTGKFEGRPFNISVRQIARRISNSRGFY